VRSLLSAGVGTTGNGLASVLRLRRVTDRAQAGCGLEVTQQSVSIWDTVVLVPSSHMVRARLRVGQRATHDAPARPDCRFQRSSSRDSGEFPASAVVF